MDRRTAGVTGMRLEEFGLGDWRALWAGRAVWFEDVAEVVEEGMVGGLCSLPSSFRTFLGFAVMIGSTISPAGSMGPWRSLGLNSVPPLQVVSEPPPNFFLSG